MTDAAEACGIQLSMIRPPAHQGLALADLVGWPTGRGCGATNAAVGFDDTTVAAFVAIGLRRGPLRIKASRADSARATRLAAAEECCTGIERAVVLGLGAVWTLPGDFRHDATARGEVRAPGDLAASRRPRQAVWAAERAQELSVRGSEAGACPQLPATTCPMKLFKVQHQSSRLHSCEGDLVST